MQTMKATTFDGIVKLAGDFVTHQQGNWDHAEWLGFLSTLQKKGFELSEEAQGHVGQVLEATKSFYQATASTRGIEKSLKSVAERSAEFVKAHQGVWSHGDWEAFTTDVQRNTLSLSEETTAYLGGILESVKAFYIIPSVSVSLLEKPATAAVEKRPAAAVEKRPAAAVEKRPAAAVEKRPAAAVEKRPVAAVEKRPAAAVEKRPAAAVEKRPAAAVEKRPVTAVEKRPAAAVEKRPVTAVEKKQVRQETKRPKEAKKQAKGPATGAEDDLTAIAGIGPALQRKLKEHGIRSFAQIAVLSDQDIARLEGSIIKFPGRIKRDDWIRQARRFSEEMR